MFENSKVMPPKPPPTALELFAKPRPTQSLIVAQVTSEPSTTAATSVAPTPPVRKRGRPRKIQPTAEQQAPMPITSDSDTTTSTGSGGDSGDVVAAALDPAKRKPKSKLRVSLKRLNMCRRQESTDSGEMPLNIRMLGAGGNSSSSSPSLSAPMIQDENAMDEQPKPMAKDPVTSVISVPDENTDSDSQIIFIEIETEGKDDDTGIDGADGQEIQVLMPRSGADHDSDDMMVEVLSGPPSLWSADDEAEDEEEVARRAAPEPEETESLSAAPRRSRRSVRGGSSNSHQGKTLEETFAEIAAESSKQILEQEQEQEQEEHLLIDLIEDSQSQPGASGAEKDLVKAGSALHKALNSLEPLDKDLPEGTSNIVVMMKKLDPTQYSLKTSPKVLIEEMAPELMPKKEKDLEQEKAKEQVPEPEEVKETETEPEPEKPPSSEPEQETVPAEATPAEPEPEATRTTPNQTTSAEATKSTTETEEAKTETAETSPDDDTTRLEAKQTEEPARDQVAGRPGPSDTEVSAGEVPLGDRVAAAITEKSPEKVEAKAEAAEGTEVEVESKLVETEAETETEAKTDHITLKTEPAKSEERPEESDPQPQPEPQPEPEPGKLKSLPQKKEATKMPTDSRKSSRKDNELSKSSSTEDSEPGKSSRRGDKEEKSSKDSTKREKLKDSSRKNSLSKKDSDSEKTPPERISSVESTAKKEVSASSEKSKSQPESEASEESLKKPSSSQEASKAKEKSSTVFVECDAMFKAMDKANAQLRLEEKSKKKLKKVAPPPPQPQPQPQSQPQTQSKATKSSSASATPAPSKKSQGKGLSKFRRNTMFEDADALWSPSSPADSDSSRVATPKPKKSRPKKKPAGSRRSTISEEAKHLGARGTPSVDLTGGSSPISTSSDASSKKARSKRSTPELVPATGLSKLELRRNTICEDRHPVEKPKAAVPLTKRRYSVHPKASASPQPQEAGKSAAAKKKPRKTPKGAMSRQNSLDSSSSASLAGGATAAKRKAQKSTEALHAALTETESSESTSSGSKMRRCDVQISPELEAPDPLKDIAKFIEDGVNLLKRDYKLDEDQKEEQPGEPTKVEPSQQDNQEDEFAQRVANIETPATTPSPSPTEESSSTSASGTQLQEGNGGVRRSHRIKKKPQGFKAGQARGVTSMALAPLSMDEQLTELANIEAINEQFLRSEGLNTFQALRENYYRCARQVSLRIGSRDPHPS